LGIRGRFKLFALRGLLFFVVVGCTQIRSKDTRHEAAHSVSQEVEEKREGCKVAKVAGAADLSWHFFYLSR
jgi:hypothetical protein